MMPLTAASMYDDIQAAFDNEAPDNANDACRIFGNAITSNIRTNAVVTYNPGTGPVPIVLSGGRTLTPQHAFPLMLVELATCIKSIAHSPPSPGFNPAGVLSINLAFANNQPLAINLFCAQLISSVLSSFPAPGMTIA